MRPDEIVRTVIALHMRVGPATITCRSHLQRDLELDPLDLVLIALRIEDIKGIEFPIAELEGAQTVADLTKIVRSLGVETSDENESAFTLDEPARTSSSAREVRAGLRRLASLRPTAQQSVCSVVQQRRPFV